MSWLHVTLKQIFFALSPLVAISFILGGCATDQAGKMRADKPSTVGIWGLAYRPNSNVGLVGDLAGMVTPKSDHKHVDENGEIKSNLAEGPAAQNIRSRESNQIDLAVHVYPGQKSNFFYGLGVNRRQRTSQVETPNVGSSLASPSFSSIEVNDDIIAVGPSIGWDTIWSNGITLLFDVGPRWDVSKSRTIKDEDTNANASARVDVDAREKLLRKYDNSGGINLFGAHLILGYSF